MMIGVLWTDGVCARVAVGRGPLLRRGIPDVAQALLLLERGLAAAAAVGTAQGGGRRARAVYGAVRGGRGEPVGVGTLRLLEVVVAKDASDVRVVFGITVSVVALTQGGVPRFRRG